MTGLITKLIIYPISILISNFLFILNYTLAQAIIVGVVLAIVAHVLEIIILRRGTLWISTIADLICIFTIVYLSQFFIANISITVLGALPTAVLLTVIEYFVHAVLIENDKVKKKDI